MIRASEKMFKKKLQIFILCSVAALAGCAKLAHLQELLTLKAYSEEKTAQQQWVAAQDEKFTKMLAAAKDGSLNEYHQARSFLRDFGDPVYARSSTCGDQPCREWLYRYAREYFDSDKIYVYFDAKGKFLKWEYVPFVKEENSDVPPR